MTTPDLREAAADRWVWLGGMLILLCAIAISFLFPFAGLVISPVLIVSGYSLYRRDTDPVMRSIALGAIITGVAIVVLIIMLLLLAIEISASSVTIGGYSTGTG